MAGKKRLDVLLTERGLAESRQKAQAIIMAGQVFWEGRRMDKAGASVPEEANLEIRGQALRYVSRGGLKLEKAMETFDLPSLVGAVAIDGSLYRRIHRLHAPKWRVKSLRGGCRIRPAGLESSARPQGCLYGTHQCPLFNQRRYSRPLDFGSVDVSFISLRLILPALRPLLKETGQLVCLIKPQFEAGKEKVGKRGWSGIRRSTWRSWSNFCSMPRLVSFMSKTSPSLPSGDQKETLNI